MGKVHTDVNTNLLRKLPHSLEAELSFLGTQLVYPNQRLGNGLKDDDFVFSDHAALFRAIRAAQDAGRSFGAVEAQSWIDGLPVGDFELKIETVIGYASGPITANERAHFIAELRKRRDIIAVSQEVMNASYSAEPNELACDIARKFIAELLDAAPVNGISWINGTDIEPKNVRFLWKNRFVANRINIIAGMGDVGKDVFCCTVAACVTTGRSWPDGSKGCEVGIVGVISPEDDPDDTIVPRLMAAGCDMSKIRIWTAKRRPTPEEITDLSLLIVSPLINLMDKKQEMNCEKDARDFLGLWQGSLKDVGCTVIGTAHLNKKTDAPIVQRILGASGIANFVRSNWTIQRDNEDKTLRLFLRLKANLVPDFVDGLQFRIQHVGPWQQSIVCTWCGTTEKTPDGVMSGNRVAKSASKWLLDFLRGKGDVQRSEIMTAAAEAGYTEAAVRKAKEKHHEVVDFQIGMPAKAWWRLEE